MAHPLLLLAVLLLCAPGLSAQETLVVTAGPDSNLINNYHLHSDADGNYTYEFKSDSGHYFVTNTDTVGPFRYISSIYGTYGSIGYSKPFEGESEQFWLRNANGVGVFGPVPGELEEHQTSDTRHLHNILAGFAVDGATPINPSNDSQPPHPCAYTVQRNPSAQPTTLQLHQCRFGSAASA